MSQLQVTGEAKIRDIQGPVVANNGVVTALDGAASQYVRGDGTLADFPTSTGGGSSVSYYLNSSVSQGTIGGVAYRELSKEPIIGAGTDIAISTNGYVANYLTDANDPDVILVPGGNFNCEFYFSVNNNTGNPTTYAELYKYDGTTFTLLGSSVGVPESINQGTTIAPYYFAIPVATATLALTDRLAIRIYVNVDGRTVTLHTENSHLCQVVTTLSKGMVSLNNLTDQSQFITTGTNGTDFNIVSSNDTHTFNIPSASASNRGLITTGTQTIAGAKTFTDNTIFSASPLFDQSANYKVGASLVGTGNYISMAFDKSGTGSGSILSMKLADGTTAKAINLDFLGSPATYTYTFPALNGTLALLEGTQTFSGGKTFTGSASFNSSLGNSPIFSYGAAFVKGNTPSATSASWSQIYSASGDNNIVIADDINTSKLQFQAASSYTYTFPASSGTLALTSDLGNYVTLATTQTITGAKTFTQTTAVTGNLLVRANSGNIGQALVLEYGTSGTGVNALTGVAMYVNAIDKLDILFTNQGTSSRSARFVGSSITNNSTREYTLPDASGTLALTSNLSSYLPLTGGTLTGALNGTSITLTNDIYLENNKFLYAKKFSGATAFSLIGITPSDKVLIDGSGMGVNFGGTIGNGTYTYTLPNATGTIALTSDIPSLSGYVPYSGATGSLNLGSYNLSVTTVYSNYINSTNGIVLPQSGSRITGAGLTSISVYNTNGIMVGFPNGQAQALAFPTATSYVYTFPSRTGTIATLEGAQTFTGATTFSSTITSTIATGIFLNNSSGGFDATQMRINNTGGDLRIGVESSTGATIQLGTSPYAAIIGNQADKPLQFTTSGTARMTITAGGNVGINLTNPQRLLEIYSATADTHLRLSGSAPSVSMGEAITGSVYQAKFGLATATNNFVIGSVAGDFVISNQTGSTIWAYNSSEIMRINTSGNLGINQSNPTYKLDVNGTARITGAATFSNSVTANNNITVLKAGSDTAFDGSYLGIGNATNSVTWGWQLGASNKLSLWYYNGGATLNPINVLSSGNVGIGTNNPNSTLQVRGDNGNTVSALVRLRDTNSTARTTRLQFEDYNGTIADGLIDFVIPTAGSATGARLSLGVSGLAMHILNGGNVGIGINNPSERLHIYGGGSGPEVRLEGSYGSWYIRAYNDNFNIYSPTGKQNISCLNNGDVRNYNNTTTWQTTSDFRVKENINTISNALNTVLLLNPVTFDYKEEFAQKNNWDNNKKIDNAGFIAQEFETIFPKYVSTSEYSIGETIIDDFKSIDTGHLVAYLVKAIQEQQAQIEELKALINK